MVPAFPHGPLDGRSIGLSHASGLSRINVAMRMRSRSCRALRCRAPGMPGLSMPRLEQGRRLVRQEGRSGPSSGSDPLRNFL